MQPYHRLVPGILEDIKVLIYAGDVWSPPFRVSNDGADNNHRLTLSAIVNTSLLLAVS
jgi:hypothetical protein